MIGKRSSGIGLALVVVAGVALVGSSGCSTTYPNRNPVGETFPSVVGEALTGDEVRVPEDFLGSPALYLVGYEQETQFDIDRWLNVLVREDLGITIRELPTIPGMAPRIFSGFIDEGMRGGIPEEDWGAVVTLYSDAAPVAEFTGNEERRRNARVLLVDGQGKVLWFWDQGHSARRAVELVDAIRALKQKPAQGG